MNYVQEEQIVIGSIIEYNDLIDLIGGLKTEHFQFGFHRAIWNACLSVLSDGKLLDVISLGDHLKTTNHFEDVGGYAGLHRLTEVTTSRTNFPLTVRRVIENYTHHVMASMHEDAAARHRTGVETPWDISTHMQAELSALTQTGEVTNTFTVQDCIEDVFTGMQRVMDGLDKKVPSGIATLDKTLGGGFGEGELIVVAGRPSMGKTAFSLNVADAASAEVPVLFFSLEMPKRQLTHRILSSLGSVPMAWIQKPDNDADLWNRLTNAAKKFQDRKLEIADKGGATLADIRQAAKRMVRKFGKVGMIVVDYIGLMTGGKSDNRTQEVGEYSRGLKSIAKEFSCPVICLAQLNRGLESRPNKRPNMSDLRDSGEIEQDADIVIMLFRDEVYNPETPDRGVAELIVTKQRNGEIGTAYASFQGAYTRFGDLAYEYKRTEPVKKKSSFGLPEHF